MLNELAPCGVFCGACPSFNKSCFGCSSNTNKNKRTKSKIHCPIRICIYTIKKQCYSNNRKNIIPDILLTEHKNGGSYSNHTCT